MTYRFCPFLWLATLALTLGPSSPARSDAPAPPAREPEWLWLGRPADGGRIWLRKSFELSQVPRTARLAASGDDRFTLYLNDQRVLAGHDWMRPQTADVTRQLRKGRNVIAVEAANDGGPAGFLAELEITSAAGAVTTIPSDGTWRASAEEHANWQQPEVNDSAWKPAEVQGTVGMASLPWSANISIDVLRSHRAGAPPTADAVRPDETIAAAPGFRVDRLFHVPRTMGSWVALTPDPRGRLIVSDQAGAGLYLVTPPALEEPGGQTQVERLPLSLSGAQGLVWANDSLYVVVNGENSGLYRATDSDGDGLLDAHECLLPIRGEGEHGPHAVVLAPDGKSLYLACGNHTDLPWEVKPGSERPADERPLWGVQRPAGVGSRIPANWGEDLLLARRWDANGHAVGRLAPGGWIARLDLDSRHWEVVSIGYRNQYDLAFNPDGELFTYDSDMEWDLGLPWYRPTRLCHATSGSEFGWRSGTGKWPAYYEDSLPPVIDIGPGSPTGVVFGTGAKFPARYQRALFLLDWTYSTIHAVHLEPDGASYRAQKEDFIFGGPLQVTDAVIHTDGALYFTVGGRGTQSALYRVTYVGDQPTQPVDGRDPRGAGLRALRHKLETLHGARVVDGVLRLPDEHLAAAGSPAAVLDLIFTNLGHEDRFIRYAARVALETQPVATWRERVLGLREPRASLAGLIALARQGSSLDLVPLLERLEELARQPLDEGSQLALLRAYQLAFIRRGAPDEPWRERVIAALDPRFPGGSDRVNAELAQLLVYLRAPAVIEKSLGLMSRLGPEPVPDWAALAQRHGGYGGTVIRMLGEMPPARAIHYAFTLRHVREGWTLDQRRAYFQFFLEAARRPGGNSYARFLSQIRDDALATLKPGERVVLGPLVDASLTAPAVAFTPPQGPGRAWTRDEALAVLGPELRGRNLQRGRNLFHAASCAKCHRLNAEGGSIGPDLSTAGRKFPLPDLLDSIIEPSKVISDQYGSHQVVTSRGQVLVGRAVEVGDELYVYTPELDAGPQVVKLADVEEMQASLLSQMPADLLHPLSEDELRDLIAYLLSGGDPKADVYR